MAIPRTKEKKEKPMSGGFLSSYHFPVGAVYNAKPQGGSEAGGGAVVSLFKSADNYWLKHREYRARRAIIEYAQAEMERVYGGYLPKSPCHDV